jgi:hypothetical protein
MTFEREGDHLLGAGAMTSVIIEEMRAHRETETT